MSYKLSIICITYNQEKFIKQALDSFVMQKTNFDFQVVISDDCSTDNTPNIIKEYEKKHPNIINKIFKLRIKLIIFLINFIKHTNPTI